MSPEECDSCLKDVWTGQTESISEYKVVVVAHPSYFCYLCEKCKDEWRQRGEDEIERRIMNIIKCNLLVVQETNEKD